MYKMQFEADGDKNILYLFRESDDDPMIEAEIHVPTGASEDYGYLTMKKSILDMKTDGLIPADIVDNLVFPYDGQEQYLADDAGVDAPCSVTVG